MKHILIPKHTKLSEKERKELFQKYGITFQQLPAIMAVDPGVEELNVKPGDIVKIERDSPTSGTTVFYRSVL